MVDTLSADYDILQFMSSKMAHFKTKRTKGIMHYVCSLVPRSLPAFQCYTQKHVTLKAGSGLGTRLQYYVCTIKVYVVALYYADMDTDLGDTQYLIYGMLRSDQVFL